MIISNAKGNIDSAYVYAKKAFYMRPRNLNFFRMSTQFARVKNDTLELLKEHKAFYKYRNTPEAWDITALELERTNFNRRKLITFINQGLKSFPTDSVLIKQKALLLSTDFLKQAENFRVKNNLSKTLEFYLKASKADPQNAVIYQNLAFYYYNQANYKEALANFRQALKIEELKSGRTEFFIGNCYLKLNDNYNACKYFKISHVKNFPDAQKQLLLNCK